MVKYMVEVDRKVCQGFGACVELCSNFYLKDEDGKSKINDGKEVYEKEENVKDIIEVEDIGCFGLAEEACPFRAIKVTRI